jgi:hypothetical protein
MGRRRPTDEPPESIACDRLDSTLAWNRVRRRSGRGRSVVPDPVAHLRRVLPMGPRVLAGRQPLIHHALAEVRGARPQFGHPVDHVPGELLPDWYYDWVLLRLRTGGTFGCTPWRCSQDCLPPPGGMAMLRGRPHGGQGRPPPRERSCRSYQGASGRAKSVRSSSRVQALLRPPASRIGLRAHRASACAATSRATSRPVKDDALWMLIPHQGSYASSASSRQGSLLKARLGPRRPQRHVPPP